MDITILENQLNGFEQRGRELREQESIFLKVQGLKEQEEKARGDALKLSTKIDALKEEIEEVKNKRSELLNEIVQTIAGRMNAILPEGEAIFRIDDSGVLIGWKINDQEKPYKALSDGEKATFNPALCAAMGADLLIVEAAEADSTRLIKILEQLSKFDGQVIVCTWFVPQEVPDNWNVVAL